MDKAIHSLAGLARLGSAILFGGFWAVFFWKMASGVISLDGLLDKDVRNDNRVDGSSIQAKPSGGRAQMLVITLSVALWYLLQVIQSPRQFPRMPDAMLVVLAGSHAAYLGGKAQGIWFRQLRDLLR